MTTNTEGLQQRPNHIREQEGQIRLPENTLKKNLKVLEPDSLKR